MSIPVKKYVDVNTGVGGASVVRERELIGRFLTPSASLIPGAVIEFPDLAAVGTVFAPNTPEYKAASQYFGYTSKLSTKARKLSMYRWIKTAIAAQVAGVTGRTGEAVLSQILATTTLIVSVDGTDYPVTGMDWTGVTTYEGVALALRTSLSSVAGAPPQLTNCQVLYTAALGQFVVQGGTPGAGTLSFVASPNSAEDAALAMGLLASSGAIVTDGMAAQTPVESIIACTEASDNFGSFGFIDSTSMPPTPISDADVVLVSQWVNAQNNKYAYFSPVTQADAQSKFDALKGYSGVGLTLADNDFAEFAPMAIGAATDYSRANASTNFMYVQFPELQPTVTDGTVSDAMDALRINYIGQTMQAGAKLTFYQRGVLMGGSTAAVDMNVYFNEMWLKDSITTSLLNMFMTLNRVPANDAGRGLVLSNIQNGTLEQAVANGVISVGKILSQEQRAYVVQLTDDPEAWRQIQNSGYWIDVEIQPYQTVDLRTEYKAVYLLVYAKDDQIRKVEGTDTLI